MSPSIQHTVNDLMRQQKWTEASRILQLALAEQPINARLQAQLGYCQFQVRDYVMAEQAFRTATMIDTRFWQAGRMHAECLDRLGRYEDALLVAEHWRVIEPNDPFLEHLTEGLRRQVDNNSGAWTKTINPNWHSVQFADD